MILKKGVKLGELGEDLEINIEWLDGIWKLLHKELIIYKADEHKHNLEGFELNVNYFIVNHPDPTNDSFCCLLWYLFDREVDVYHKDDKIFIFAKPYIWQPQECVYPKDAFAKLPARVLFPDLDESFNIYVGWINYIFALLGKRLVVNNSGMVEWKKDGALFARPFAIFNDPFPTNPNFCRILEEIFKYDTKFERQENKIVMLGDPGFHMSEDELEEFLRTQTPINQKEC